MDTKAKDRASADQLELLGSKLMALSYRIRNGSSIDTERTEILAATTQISNTLSIDDPVEDMFISFAKAVSIRLFIEWGVFAALPPLPESISITELAAKCSVSSGLLIRYTWTLLASGILHSPAPNHISHTPRSLTLTTASSPIMARFLFDELLPPISSSPAYFAQHGRNEPTCRKNSIFAFGHGKPGTFVWDVVNSSPERMRNCFEAMKAMDGRYGFLEGGYQLSWAVEIGKREQDRVLVVDVGGGAGQALKVIARSTKGLEMGRCVLEDLPRIVEAAKKMGDKELDGVKYVGMDLHKEQPVQGAAVYYVRRVLHDYGDEACVGILRKLREAMVNDSRVLIVEQIMGNPPALRAAASNVVMTCLSGKERSLECFGGLVERAGMRVVGVHWGRGREVALIECARA